MTMITETLSFHVKTGVRVIYSFEDDNGTPRDMSAADVEFSASNGYTKALDQTGGGSDTMELVLYGRDVSALLNKPARYLVLDKTQDPPAVVASGVLIVTGWL